MAQQKASVKRNQIDKANTTIFAVVAVSMFLVIFSVIAARALWTRQAHQSEVIEQKEIARDQLRENINTVDELVVSYKAFVETPQNVIGGNPDGKGEKDGDNAKIILDALPSKYDFPGLATSLEKILKDNGSSINSISGTDDEVAQSGPQSGPTNPIEIPFQLSATGTYESTQKLLGLLQRSIRPIQVQALEFSGTNSDLEVSVTAKTYYQPAKTLKLQMRTVE